VSERKNTTITPKKQKNTQNTQTKKPGKNTANNEVKAKAKIKKGFCADLGGVSEFRRSEHKRPGTFDELLALHASRHPPIVKIVVLWQHTMNPI
jgi:hypothetical protein